MLLTYIPGVLAVFAVVSLSFAGLQFYEARQKRIEAQEALQRVKAAEARINQAESHIKQLTDQAEFSFASPDARSDGRRAFDMLRRIAVDSENFCSERAKIELNVIVRNLGNPIAGIGGIDRLKNRIYPWREGIDPNKVTVEEAEKELVNVRGLNAAALIAFIAGNTNYSKAKRLNCLIRTYRVHESLRVVYAAELFLKAEDKNLENLQPFSYQQIEKWWEENKIRFSEGK